MALQAGVTICFGGDVGVFAHGDNAREMELMVGYGMKPADVLRSATSVNADVFGYGDRIGRIKKGLLADIVVVEGDVLQSIKSVRNVKLVIKDSTGKEDNYTFERAGSNYQLNTGIRAGGTYNYTASTTHNGKTYTAAGSFVIESIPLELMETGADYNMLYNLADKNNGAFFPASNIASVYDSIVNNESLKPVIETNVETVPLIDRKWFFILILLLAVAEWLLRKYWLAQ